MSKQLRVGIICGGTSCEHEISLLSAKNVVQALASDTYEVVPIFIDKNGLWHTFKAKELLETGSIKKSTIQLKGGTQPIPQLPEMRLDVAFPLVHGPFGEDGTIQGFLKLARIPFVGSCVLGSAVGMDKEVAKRLLRDAGL